MCLVFPGADVMAAGAVVVKPVPAGAKVAGVPAGPIGDSAPAGA